MKFKYIHWGLFALLGSGIFSLGAYAASSKITYQGQLRESGVPVSADRSMIFRIFSSSTGGSAVWTSGAQTVTVTNGLFRTLLQPTGVSWENTLFMEVVVEGTTLSPREELTASPYSIDSQLLTGKAYTSSNSAPSSPAAGDLWFDTSSDTLNVYTGTVWDQVSSGIGAGSISVSNGGVIVEAGATQVEFSSTNFLVTSGPVGVANVSFLKNPAAAGIINLSTNPVDWSQLKNVPAGFADGTDSDSSLPAAFENGVLVDSAVSTFNFSGPQFDLTSSPSGQANVSLSGSSVTLQGNSFNAASQLVKLTTGAALAINGWGMISQMMTQVKSISFAASAAGACSSDIVDIPGARDGDVVTLGLQSSLAVADVSQVIMGYVSSNDVVTVRRCNACAVPVTCAALTAVTSNVRVDVWRH